MRIFPLGFQRFTAAAFLVLALPAQAAFVDGNYLTQLIAANDIDPNSHKAGLLSGYTAGAADAGNGRLFCLADNVTVGQSEAIVAKYLKENPELWNKPADQLISAALARAFPCPTPPPQAQPPKKGAHTLRLSS